jgi:hypothetical protein
MTAAMGIHDHPTKKIGKRDPSNGPAIEFGAHLIQAPNAPIVDPAPQLVWPMDENDAWGDCVVAGARDHALEAILKALTAPTLT